MDAGVVVGDRMGELVRRFRWEDMSLKQGERRGRHGLGLILEEVKKTTINTQPEIVGIVVLDEERLAIQDLEERHFRLGKAHLMKTGAFH